MLPDCHFPVEESLVVEHGDGLDRLDRVVELDDCVSSRLSLFVPVKLGHHHASRQTENLTKLLLVNRVRQVGHKQTVVQGTFDTQGLQELKERLEKRNLIQFQNSLKVERRYEWKTSLVT